MTKTLDNGPDDIELERMLLLAGRRVQPSETIEHAVREAVRVKWLAAVEQHRRRRLRRFSAAIAASVVLIVLGSWIGWNALNGPAAPIATIARISGQVSVTEGDPLEPQVASDNQALRVGQILRTGASGRVSLSYPDGTSVRLDHDTSIALIEPDRLVMSNGAVYVDTSDRPSPLQIDTPYGAIRHIGTQYEVRQLDENVRVRVREGEIALTHKDGNVLRGRAGEQLTVSSSGEVDRTTVPAYGPEWDWTGEAAPAIPIDGRPLAEFLSWVGRELGYEVVYVSPEIQTQAASVSLRGSVDGLTPRQALAAVLSTTRLTSIERDGRLLIDTSPSER